jgi:hypothetical protein
MRHGAIVLKFLGGVSVEQDHCHGLDEAEFSGHLVDETTLMPDQVAPAIVVHIVGVNVEAQHRVRLTIRLSDAGARGQTKLIYLDHRPPPWLTEGATRDRSNRLLAVYRPPSIVGDF